jgi:hypothetical protein
MNGMGFIPLPNIVLKDPLLKEGGLLEEDEALVSSLLLCTNSGR